MAKEKAEKFYLSTSITYASGEPHIGNTYEAVFVDSIARYKRLRGCDVHFLTGTDEHGQKIQRKAEESGVTPQQFVDGVTAKLRGIWDLMNVEYDDFIRTTEPRHKEVVQKIFKKLYEKGDIYKDAYEGWYCVPDESFFTDTQAGENHICPDCGRPVERASEEAYFFRLSKYQQPLLDHINSNPDFIAPESRKNEMLGFIKQGLQDFCVSRTSFTWGVPVDFAPGHVVYVWVDALSNYITALGYDPEGKSGELFEKYWPCDAHIIGKDILRFHTLYWPAMLLGLGLPLPRQVFAHPWFLMGQDKMSKSRGNTLYATELANDYGVDAVRYYLLREMPYAQDGTITRELIVTRCNADLANDIGNLASRTTAMAVKYFSGNVPSGVTADERSLELLALCAASCGKYAAAMDKLNTSAAIAAVMDFVSAANGYIDKTEPWKLGKDPSSSALLGEVLRTLCEVLRRASVMLWPVMPVAMQKLRMQLGLAEKPVWDEPSPESFTVFKGENLFPRMELPVQEEAEPVPAVPAPAPVKDKHETPEPPSEIAIDDFMKVELCVAKVLECVPVEKSDKLLKLTLDAGEAEPRTVASGIALWYKPEELVGKSVCLVKNLKPAKLRGVVSRGMILAADCGDRAVVVFAPEGLEPGAKIR